MYSTARSRQLTKSLKVGFLTTSGSLFDKRSTHSFLGTVSNFSPPWRRPARMSDHEAIWALRTWYTSAWGVAVLGFEVVERTISEMALAAWLTGSHEGRYYEHEV